MIRIHTDDGRYGAGPGLPSANRTPWDPPIRSNPEGNDPMRLAEPPDTKPSLPPPPPDDARKFLELLRTVAYRPQSRWGADTRMATR